MNEAMKVKMRELAKSCADDAWKIYQKNRLNNIDDAIVYEGGAMFGYLEGFKECAELYEAEMQRLVEALKQLEEVDDTGTGGYMEDIISGALEAHAKWRATVGE